MDVHVEIAAETLFDLGPIPVTNSMLTMFIVMGLLILAGWLIARNAKEVPSRSQSILEMIVEFLLGLVESTAGRKLGRQIFPLVGGLFIFILFANYSGLLPGVGTIGVYRTEEEAAHTTEEGNGGDEPADNPGVPDSETQEDSQVRVFDVAATGSAASSLTTLDQENGSDAAEEEEHKVLVPFLRAPNADLNMTLAMALVTFTAVQILGIRAHGVGGRIRHMADPPFLFPIELVSELSRIISLSARLFGNVFAGEVLLGVMYAMAAAIKVAVVPFIFPVIFLFLEVLFGAVQALVFALLTLIYIALAAAEHGHDDQAEHAHAHDHGTAPATVSHAAAD
jgi:F-type H+-transporting ATPase subunit a